VILVSVGTHFQRFERLVASMDELAARSPETVIIQTGFTPYRPAHAQWFPFKERAEMEALIRQARVLVTHGGAGSLITGLRLGTPIVAVPRLRRYGEHVDDHQVELIEALARQGKIVAVYDLAGLADAIELAATRRSAVQQSPDAQPGLARRLRAYVEALDPAAGRARRL
jgi:UDP-N-acetylglucosamine transferase subunit ALG13